MRYFTCCIWLAVFSGVCEATVDFNICGTVTPGWEFIVHLFRDNFVHDRDLGASVAVYYQGQLAFELSGGWFDQSHTKPYDYSTLQLVFSATKGLVAGAVALSVQNNYLDYAALVTDYWPEYGQNGKENTTVADILSHRAGLPDLSTPVDQYPDWRTIIKELEQKAPIWSPGSAHGYHSLTFGWLAGELVRRSDPKRRSFGRFVQEEIADRMALEFYVGLPSRHESRVSPVELSLESKTSLNESTITLVNSFNQPSMHQAEIPAGNGITNARSLAKFYASLIGDLNNGEQKRLLDEDTLRLATKSNTPADEIDLVFDTRTVFGMGFTLFDDIFPAFGRGTFGHTGAGGSIGFAAPAKNLTFAFVMNRLDTSTVFVDVRIESMLEKIAEFVAAQML